ncbi:uncharacterized protein LOC111319934, partial [Stylophora pistillata]|uniref:uncharacterized protein LOC111319934 n=1 Tax=Stylophora pistillata TaxID=50429 RepID=UPI000C042C36
RSIRPRRFWAREIYRCKKAQGEFNYLVSELRGSDRELYFRLPPFQGWPTYKKQAIKFTQPISPSERLALTIRYLASGDSQQSMSFSY